VSLATSDSHLFSCLASSLTFITHFFPFFLPFSRPPENFLIIQRSKSFAAAAVDIDFLWQHNQALNFAPISDELCLKCVRFPQVSELSFKDERLRCERFMRKQ